MGADCKSVAFLLRWFESTRSHQQKALQNLDSARLFAFWTTFWTTLPVESFMASDSAPESDQLHLQYGSRHR